MFGIDPRKFYTGAFIKIGKFGKSDDDLLSQEVVEVNVFELANRTLEILDKKYIKKPISYNGSQRIETMEYPYQAIREALLNAIVHRQYPMGGSIQISLYDDRIMIWNFGTLLYPMTFDDLKRKHSSHPRNPILADVFFKGGLIESWGRGTIKIINECKKAGLPTPKITEMTDGIVVTLYKNIYIKEHLSKFELNERQLEALLLWKEKGEIVTNLYAEKFGIEGRTARRDITELVEKDLLIKTGDLKTTKYFFKGRDVR